MLIEIAGRNAAVEFPDNMDHEHIRRVLAENFPAQNEEQLASSPGGTLNEPPGGEAPQYDPGMALSEIPDPPDEWPNYEAGPSRPAPPPKPPVPGQSKTTAPAAPAGTPPPSILTDKPFSIVQQGQRIRSVGEAPPSVLTREQQGIIQQGLIDTKEQDPPTFMERMKDAFLTLSGPLGAASEAYVGQTDVRPVMSSVKQSAQSYEAVTALARGLIAWPVSKAVAGLTMLAYQTPEVRNAPSMQRFTSAGELARHVEEGVAEAITMPPADEKARNVYETAGQVLGVPFLPAIWVGERIGNLTNPTLGYTVGSALEVLTPMLIHSGIKNAVRFGEIYRFVKDGKDLPSHLQAVVDSMELKERDAYVEAVEAIRMEDPATVKAEFSKAGIPVEATEKFLRDISDIPTERPYNAPIPETRTPVSPAADKAVSAITQETARPDFWQGLRERKTIEEQIDFARLEAARYPSGKTFAEAIGEVRGDPTGNWKAIFGDEVRSARDFWKLNRKLTTEKELRQALADDPAFVREESLDRVIRTAEDDIIGIKEELYEAGYGKAEVNRIIREAEAAVRDQIAGTEKTAAGQSLEERIRELTGEETPLRVPEPELASDTLINTYAAEIGLQIGEHPLGRTRGLSIEDVKAEMPVNREKARFSFEDAEQEFAFRQSQGAPKKPILDTLKEYATALRDDFTRAFRSVPNTGEFAQFQFDLLRLKKQKSISSYNAIQAIRGITDKLDSYTMDLFTRKVILEDFKYTHFEQKKNVAFGFGSSSIPKEISRIDAEIAKHPEVQAALARRKTMWDALRKDYADLRAYFGDDVTPLLKNENYFRHQVLDYAQVKDIITGERLDVPTQRGFLKKRTGDESRINTNYLEAEYDVMSQVMQDIATMQVLKAIDKHYNIAEKIREEAKAKKAKDWHDEIPEGYTTWQPIEGSNFYMADSIPAKMAEALRNGTLAEIGITANDLRQILSVGNRRLEFVVKNEIAQALDTFGERTEEPILFKGIRKSLNAWKIWTLINPRRVFKYNMRNLSGDADVMVAGNPSGFRRAPRAMQELYEVFFHDKPMTGELKEWFNRGGMDSTLQVQELGDVNALAMFKKLSDEHGGLMGIPAKGWKAYWKAARMTTDFREAILRYANYLDYLEQIEKDGKPRNYGASRRAEIDALTDPRDKAFWLSNDLLGAYDRVSVAGQALRKYLVPFYSFKEVNFKRYIQLAKNAAEDGMNAQAVGYRILGPAALHTAPRVAYKIGSFVMKASAMWAAFQAWNYTFFPDEERSLSLDESSRAHLILGRDDNGKIIYFNRLGSAGDFLEWFGLDDSWKYVDNWMKGRMTLSEIARDMAKSPINVMVQGINPFMKLGAEELMGRSLFPNVFKPAMIRDRGFHLARAFALENEYKAAMGIPSEGYANTMSAFVYYKTDSGQVAYGEIQELKHEFLKKLGKGFEGFILTPRSQALYNLKLALRYGDEEGFVRYATEYEQHGGTPQGLEKSLAMMEPLAGLKPAEGAEFIKRLSADERDKLLKAYDFYETVLLGNKIKRKRK